MNEIEFSLTGNKFTPEMAMHFRQPDLDNIVVVDHVLKLKTIQN